MTQKLTEKQYIALKKYEDEKSHNETALRIHGRVYSSLTDKGLLKRTVAFMSRITPEGREALIAHEKKLGG